MPGLFQVSVKGVYVKDSRALLLEADSDDGKRYWDLPGGRIEQGEQPQEALLREVSEELPTLQESTVGDLLYAELSWHLDAKCELIIFYYRISGLFDQIELTNEHAGYRWVDLALVRNLVQSTGQDYFDKGMDVALRAALA